MPEIEKIIVRDHPQLDFMDAFSRVFIDMLNAVGKDGFAHYGDFTVLEKDLMVFRNGLSSLQFSSEGLTVQEQALDGSFKFRTLSPLRLADPSENVMPPMDWRFLCKKLKLTNKNMDQIHGRVIRVFCDNLMGGGGPAADAMLGMSFFNATGAFEAFEEVRSYDNESFAFEKKFFKINSIPGIFSLLFKPSRSRLFLAYYARTCKNEPLCITTNLKLVLSWNNTAMAWLQNCGDLARIDWNFFQERQGIFLLPYSMDAPLAARNTWAEALAFSAEARKNGIKITIKKLMVANPETISPTEPLRMEDMNENQILAEAKKYNLPIPLILKGDPYRIKLNSTKEAPEPLIPEMLDRHSMTYFYGKSCFRLIPNILPVFQGISRPQGKEKSPPFMTVIIVPPERVYRIKKMLEGGSVEKLSVFASTKLDEKDGMTELFEEDPEVLLFLCHGEPSVKVLNAVDMCLSASKTVGVFDDSESENVVASEMAERVIFVGCAGENNYFIKDMKKHTVHKFNFQGTEVVVNASNEDELAAEVEA